MTPLLGLWTIFSPWLVADTDPTARVIVNNLILGIVILVLGLLALGAGVARSKR